MYNIQANTENIQISASFLFIFLYLFIIVVLFFYLFYYLFYFLKCKIKQNKHVKSGGSIRYGTRLLVSFLYFLLNIYFYFLPF